ncbi:GTPase HflX, partial [Clostridium perfringens]|nr:GTPase HflX [Clostridium perfringens]
MIFGNIDGINKSYLDELERLYKVKVLKDEVCSREIIEIISRLTSILEREISVAVDRRGKGVSVAIGDSTSVEVAM